MIWRWFAAAEGTIAIDERVLVRLRREAERADPEECMGLLAGRACLDEVGEYTVVVGAVVARGAVQSRAHVSSTVAEMAVTRRALTRRYPVADLVGWWHTHPGFGTFYSRTDEITQATFDAPYAVGLVIDPRIVGLTGVGAYLGPASIRLNSEGALPELPRDRDRVRTAGRHDVGEHKEVS